MQCVKENKADFFSFFFLFFQEKLANSAIFYMFRFSVHFLFCEIVAKSCLTKSNRYKKSETRMTASVLKQDQNT